MLVFSRREEQGIDLPDLGVRIVILGFNRARVRVGIEAPRNVLVLRSELVSPAFHEGPALPPEMPVRSGPAKMPVLPADTAAY